MPQNPTLIIEESDGTQRDKIECKAAESDFSLIEMWIATATIDRGDWLDVKSNVDVVNDVFRIERGDNTTLLEGRIGDDTRDGNTVDILVQSYERDAQDAEPTDPREIYENVNDSSVFSDAIGDVPSLSTGTVETDASSVSFTFANAMQAKKVRDAAEPGGQDVVYNNDQTADFLDRLGSDKSGSITVSSANQDIVNRLSVEDNSVNPVTHIKGLGAQQGGEQVTATATIASYSAGDRKVWREYENKDIVNEDRMQAIVDRLATEANNARRRLTVEAELVDVDVSLGDSITVDLAQHNINQSMRIVRLRERIDSAVSKVVTLSNKRPERGGDKKRRDDLNRFNSGDQGFVDRDVDSFGWQPVTSSTNATRPYPYPDDVVREDKAEVTVKSIAYRSFSAGGASGGGSTETSADNSEYSNVIFTEEDSAAGTSIDNTWTTLTSFIPGSDCSELRAGLSLGMDGTGNDAFIQVRLRNASTGTNFPGSAGITKIVGSLGGDEGGFVTWNELVDATNVNGDSLRLQAKTSFDIGSKNVTFTSVFAGIGPHTHSIDLPDHTHPPEPGLNEFTSETVTNADLIVNGSTVATDFDTGTFETTVDIAGELTSGTNTIEVTSDSLGLVNIQVSTELFRSGGPAT